MEKFYVNRTAQPNGDHEVHREGCYWLSIAAHTTYLGEFYGCSGAVAEAKKTYKTANGCASCCPTCHTS